VAELAAASSVRDRVDPLSRAPADRERLGRDDLLTAWRDARAATLAAFADADDHERVPWGGRDMAVQSLATARLMETWAHGLDCFAAFEVEPVDTSRLRHVAWLGWKTLPHAFALAGVAPVAPPARLRIEVTSPDGTEVWSHGPGDATDLVVGAAGDWCRIVTHRLRSDRAQLTARGELAEQSLEVARAFL
jgi:uncharacterized protein (TIGR03084 family)